MRAFRKDSDTRIRTQYDESNYQIVTPELSQISAQELREVVLAWPLLSEPLRLAILALVRTACPHPGRAMPGTEAGAPNNGLFEQVGQPRFRGRFFVRFIPGLFFCPVDIRGGQNCRTEVRVHCPHFSQLTSEHREQFVNLFGHQQATIHEVEGCKVDGHRFTGLRIFLFGRLNWLKGGVEPRGKYEFFGGGGPAPQARASAREGAGLFKAHIRPLEIRPSPHSGIPRNVTTYPGGQLLEIDSWTYPLGVRPSNGVGGGKRGSITEFSRESRMRLLKAVCKLEIVPENCLFMTLTYPAEFPGDAETINAHYAAFVKRLRRSFPRFPATPRSSRRSGALPIGTSF